jgi:hypothetical protein
MRVIQTAVSILKGTPEKLSIVLLNALKATGILMTMSTLIISEKPISNVVH